MSLLTIPGAFPRIRYSKTKKRFIKESYSGKGRPRNSDYGKTLAEYLNGINRMLDEIPQQEFNVIKFFNRKRRN